MADLVYMSIVRHIKKSIMETAYSIKNSDFIALFKIFN